MYAHIESSETGSGDAARPDPALRPGGRRARPPPPPTPTHQNGFFPVWLSISYRDTYRARKGHAIFQPHAIFHPRRVQPQNLYGFVRKSHLFRFVVVHGNIRVGRGVVIEG